MANSNEMVTVNLERYEALLEQETRLSVLRLACVRELQKTEKMRNQYSDLYSVETTNIKVKDVLDIIGANFTYDGFEGREIKDEPRNNSK